MNRWNTTKIIAAGSIGVLFLVLALFGAALQLVLNFPGASGFINVFVGSCMYVLACLVVRQFGAATITSLVYFVLSLPLPLGLVPGFLPKILIGLIVGISSDFLFNFLKNKERISSILIGGSSQVIIGIIYVLSLQLLPVSGAQNVPSFFFKPLGLVIGLTIAFSGGSIGGYIGYVLYGKIKNTAIVKRIQGSND